MSESGGGHSGRLRLPSFQDIIDMMSSQDMCASDLCVIVYEYYYKGLLGQPLLERKTHMLC